MRYRFTTYGGDSQVFGSWEAGARFAGERFPNGTLDTGGKIEVDGDLVATLRPETPEQFAADVQRTREQQAFRILETLNAVRPLFSCGPTSRGWMVRDGRGAECHGVTLTDALAQFATAVGLEATL